MGVNVLGVVITLAVVVGLELLYNWVIRRNRARIQARRDVGEPVSHNIPVRIAMVTVGVALLLLVWMAR